MNEDKMKLENSIIYLNDLLTEDIRIDDITKERDSIYKDYKDLGKEFYNSIPKKKIEDKIKEIENCKMDIVQSSIHNVNEKMKMLDRNIIKREVLQDLLEDK